MTRFETLFSIRYAVRVLERSSRFWAKTDALLKALSLLAGSSAIYAIAAQNQTISIAFGIFFAATQAVEFSVRPSDKSSQALAERLPYARLFANQAKLSDDELEAEYLSITVTDEYQCMECIRRVAYNDVVEERCDDRNATYVLTVWQRFMAMFA